MAMLRARQVFNKLMEGCSMSVVKGEYSICMAVMGWMACARRRVVEETSERPRWEILPSLVFFERGGS